MRYQALASDYDGTLAHDGLTDDATVRALERLLVTGRRLVMVTGREVPDLMATFARLDLFEWIVAENGALLYRPSTREEKLLGPAPPPAFLEALRKHKVPMSVGRAIVATVEPHEKVVLEAIHELGLELQVIFNKGSVMVLPAGVNKATGLAAALDEMGLSPHNVVGVGDAENDHAFLRLCECSVAVANALPTVKETADVVTRAARGAGVVELIDELLATDLAPRAGQLARHVLHLGTREDGTDLVLPAYGPNVLIAGPSASGKSTLATGLLERLVEGKRQFCAIDPEGDYESFKEALVLGGPGSAPSVEEALRLLESPKQSAVISLTGLPLEARPAFFQTLFGQLLQLRARTGRPHWLILDEAHHLMPATWQPPEGALPEGLNNILLITVHPELLAPALLEHVDTLLAVGETATAALEYFARVVHAPVPAFAGPALEPGEVLVWSRQQPQTATRGRGRPNRTERRRHRRKYSEGALQPERSFYFKGPEGRLNLRAQNLLLFLQLADGLDDETWLYHLHQGDYARWFRDNIKDEALAAEAERIERLETAQARESRALVRAAIERDYTVPATPPPRPDSGRDGGPLLGE